MSTHARVFIVSSRRRSHKVIKRRSPSVPQPEQRHRRAPRVPRLGLRRRDSRRWRPPRRARGHPPLPPEPTRARAEKREGVRRGRLFRRTAVFEILLLYEGRLLPFIEGDGPLDARRRPRDGRLRRRSLGERACALRVRVRAVRLRLLRHLREHGSELLLGAIGAIALVLARPGSRRARLFFFVCFDGAFSAGFGFFSTVPPAYHGAPVPSPSTSTSASTPFRAAVGGFSKPSFKTESSLRFFFPRSAAASSASTGEAAGASGAAPAAPNVVAASSTGTTRAAGDAVGAGPRSIRSEVRLRFFPVLKRDATRLDAGSKGFGPSVEGFRSVGSSRVVAAPTVSAAGERPSPRRRGSGASPPRSPNALAGRGGGVGPSAAAAATAPATAAAAASSIEGSVASGFDGAFAFAFAFGVLASISFANDSHRARSSRASSRRFCLCRPAKGDRAERPTNGSAESERAEDSGTRGLVVPAPFAPAPRPTAPRTAFITFAKTPPAWGVVPSSAWGPSSASGSACVGAIASRSS